MKRPAALLIALALANSGRAATAYVTDELVLGVYSQQTTEGTRLATLHSGATVETLASQGDATQVRLADGTVGWVKSAYLVTSEPSQVRLKQLVDQLERSGAMTPLLAEAAERNEVARLKSELAQRPQPRPLPASGVRTDSPPSGTKVSGAWLRWWGLSLLLTLGGGFWLGYAVLARRINAKFGGIKVY